MIKKRHVVICPSLKGIHTLYKKKNCRLHKISHCSHLIDPQEMLAFSCWIYAEQQDGVTSFITKTEFMNFGIDVLWKLEYC